MTGEQSAPKQRRRHDFIILLLVLGGALAVLCHEGFLPHRVMWANDEPLGAMMDPSNTLPGTFTGHWGTLYYIGGPVPSSSPSFSSLLQWILPPTIYLKVYAPITMFVLGLGAWFFFRQLGFSPAASIIAALGAGLNMHFFSNACWGLGQWNISAAMMLLSMAILVSPNIRPPWLKAALAGLSVGMVVMEGFDVGAILSLYVGMFIVFYFLRTAETPVLGIPKAIGMGAVVVLFALFISGSTLYTLIGTQIKGTTNAAGSQSAEEKKAHWNFTTQWSFPKLETIRLIIPGLMGYRLQDYITDTNKASAYWGSIAEDPHIDELESSDPKVRANSAKSLGLPQQYQDIMAGDDMNAREQVLDQIKAGTQRRHTGSGDYTGVLVCLLAFFGLFNSWRKEDSPFSENERQMVWFWGIAALISLFACWGRYSWLYQFIYHLPFINNIRNPIKFLHALNICLIILSGYGLESLYRGYLAKRPEGKGNWWQRLAGFDKKWVIALPLVVLVAAIGLLIYVSNKADMIHYLSHAGFPEDMAPQMYDFSVHEVVMFICFLIASVAVIAAILCGFFAGKRAIFAWAILSLIMAADLGRADQPWIRYYDWQYKYSMNPVVDFLRHDPWEHRVMSRFIPTGGYIPTDNGALPNICHWWLENDYLANNIESLEVDQSPRLPDLDRNYIGDFSAMSAQDLSGPVRLWRLTNTKYIFADARLTDALNTLAEPHNSFRTIMRMDIVQKPDAKGIEDAGDLTVQTNDTGGVALIEFTAALPRAKLYANWLNIDDNTALAVLNSPKFDPAQLVLVAKDTSVADKPTQPAADPGTVKITDYQPKYVKLDADAKTAAVLLLNDKTDENWRAWIDDKPAGVLRCNYIMRGVFVPAGHHTIEFRFLAPLQWLYVSSSAFIIGVLMVGYVVVTRWKAPAAASSPTSRKS
jgi:hypothetical protein